MKKKVQLPSSSEAVIALHKSIRNFKLPSISRIITEYQKQIASTMFTFPAIIFYTSLVILFFIFSETLTLRDNYFAVQALEMKRGSIEQEIAYWKTVTGKYKEYRDPYLRLAVLEYTLGDSNAAKIYIQKALEIDPEYEDAKIFASQIRS